MLEEEARRVACNTEITLEQLVASRWQMLAKIIVARDGRKPAPFLAHRNLRLFDNALKLRLGRQTACDL